MVPGGTLYPAMSIGSSNTRMIPSVEGVRRRDSLTAARSSGMARRWAPVIAPDGPATESTSCRRRSWKSGSLPRLCKSHRIETEVESAPAKNRVTALLTHRRSFWPAARMCASMSMRAAVSPCAASACRTNSSAMLSTSSMSRQKRRQRGVGTSVYSGRGDSVRSVATLNADRRLFRKRMPCSDGGSHRTRRRMSKSTAPIASDENAYTKSSSSVGVPG
mmetsp:Transcript_10455/g.26319  ORF Transcript_10455/g.26319 Transcript_10455/m.26319 type:complete len:219 (-) Transcript_10455:608-1264(-)